MTFGSLKHILAIHLSFGAKISSKIFLVNVKYFWAFNGAWDVVEVKGTECERWEQVGELGVVKPVRWSGFGVAVSEKGKKEGDKVGLTGV